MADYETAGSKMGVDCASECPQCHERVDLGALKANLRKCPQCDHYYRMPARERLASVADEGSFVAFGEGIAGGNPLGFEGYDEKIASVSGEGVSGIQDLVCTIRAKV